MNLSFHQFIQQIFLQGFSCYGPLNWQWLPCFTRKPSRSQSIQRLWRTKSSSTAPSRSHMHRAEAAIPLLLPRLCQFVFHLHRLYQAWCLFSCLWRREGGEREIFMNVVLYLLFFCVSLLFLVFWSLSSSCIQLLHPEQGSKVAPQQWPICLEVHGEEEGQSYVDKKTVQNSRICFNMLQNILAFSLTTCKDKVPIKNISSIDLKL